MLPVSQVDDQLLFRSGVKTEVRLVGEVVRMKDDLYEGRLRHEGLGLFALSAEHPRFLSVRYVGFGIAIYNLEEKNVYLTNDT